MRQLKFIKWARIFYVLGLVFALVFIIPNSWFPFQLCKIALFSVCLLVSAILFVCGGGIQSLLKDRGYKAMLLVALLPIIYVTSFLISTKTVGIAGLSVENDTLLFVSLGFLAFFMSFAFFRTTKTARMLLVCSSIVLVVAAAFQFVVVLFGTSAIPFLALADRSVNLIGKWNDFDSIVGLILLFTLVWMEFLKTTRIQRIVAGIIALVSVFLLGVINIPLVWLLLLCSSLLISVISFIHLRSVDKHGKSWSFKMIPIMSSVVAVICVVFLTCGTIFSAGLTKQFPITSFEVRPTSGVTLSIVGASHGGNIGRLMLGTGPATFSEQWLLHKPHEVNQSPFWNLDFVVGFSTVMTALGSVGIFGAIAWLIPLLLVAVGMIYAMRRTALSMEELAVMLCLGLGGIYMWVTALLYAPSQNILLFGFALCGAAFGFATSENRNAKTDSVDKAAQTRLEKMRTIVVALALIALSLWVSVAVVRRFASQVLTGEGTFALGQGNISNAISFADRAQSIEINGDDLRLGADARYLMLQQMSSSVSIPTNDQKMQFMDYAQRSISLGKQAVSVDAYNYQSYLSLGRVYDTLDAIKVPGAYENAQQSYTIAESYDPLNPQIPLMLARLAYRHGDMASMQTNISQALALKPDYTDAILFIVQYDVARNDIVNATHAAQLAVKSSPTAPQLWLELGLLYYSGKDYTDAAMVLEQAVKLQPDYANAKYFLGVSYAMQGRMSDAIGQFTDLNLSNPGNSELQLILKELQSGNQVFQDVQQKVTTPQPEQAKAPVSR